MSNPLTLPPGPEPLPAGTPRRPVWTWGGSLLFLGTVLATQFAADFLAAMLLVGMGRLGVDGLHDWVMPLLNLTAGLAALALLVSQRRRLGAKPLWDWADLKDWRGWLMAAAVLACCALANVVRIAVARDPATPVLNQEVLDLLAGAAVMPWAKLATIGLTIVVLAPLTEEWLFRGIVQPALGVRWGQWVAVPLTALLFGLMHGLSVWWVPAVYGLALGLLSRRQRSLALPMLVHGVINLAVFLLLLSAG